MAELATANIWFAKDGEAHTPVPNGTFLNGVTRQRVVKLLRGAGITVHERSIRWSEFLEADEVFSTGNYAKVAPITRVEQQEPAARPHHAEGARPLLGLCAGRAMRSLSSTAVMPAELRDGYGLESQMKAFPRRHRPRGRSSRSRVTMRPLAAQHVIRQRHDQAVGRGGWRGLAKLAGQFLFVQPAGETCKER